MGSLHVLHCCMFGVTDTLHTLIAVWRIAQVKSPWLHLLHVLCDRHTAYSDCYDAHCIHSIHTLILRPRPTT